MSLQRKGRDLSYTIKDLMQSPRLKLAVELFDKDPMLLKAILTEFGLECITVAKTRTIRRVEMHEGLTKQHLIPFLRSLDLDEFNTFNIWWGMSDVERQLYVAKANGASKEDLEKLVDKVNGKMGITKLMEEKDNG